VLSRWDGEVRGLVVGALGAAPPDDAAALIDRVMDELFEFLLAHRDWVSLSARAALGEGLPPGAELEDHSWVRFLGNVTVGRDLTVEELRRHYHAVIWAVGAETDRQLGIPGEMLAGSHAATEFVGWYNGHPDYRDRSFDLTQESAAVIGLGNVAMDVTRILGCRRARHRHRYAPTRSGAAECGPYLLGRRGPVQAVF
jgi:hypothetical protein